jgi:hypothetical protein
LANAGYQYLKETDSFTQSPYTQPIGSTAGWSAAGSSGVKPSTWATTMSETCILDGSTLGVGTGPWGAPGVCVNGDGVNADNRTNTTCPTGYIKTGSNCVPNASTPPTPVTVAQVETGLATKNMTPAGDTDAAKAGIVDELLKNGITPDHETEVLTGPSTVQGEHSITTTPDGNVTTTNTVFTNTYSTNTVDIVRTTTTTTTIPPSTKTEVAPPDAPPADSKTDCDKYPDSIGCAKFGTIPTADKLPITYVSLNLNVGGYSAGECPSPQTLSLSRGTFSLSNQPLCDLATGTKPLFIALAYLAAGYIVLGSVRGS